ncbi:unnamed protein product [Closterium sp. Naga37s-1]|nr:unnamed protein product [Closterium sp. Naga37s-1]
MSSSRTGRLSGPRLLLSTPSPCLCSLPFRPLFSSPSPSFRPSSSPFPPTLSPHSPPPALFARSPPSPILPHSRTQDVADLLLRALRRSNEVTLLAPSPDAAKAELPDGSPLVKSKKTMRRLLRYCLILGRLVSYTNLVEDPAGTKYPTMYGQPQVKSAESSFFTVYFRTPSGKENSTLVAPNLFEGKFLQVHLVSDVLIPDGFFGSPSPPPEEDDPVDQTPPTETGSAGAASTPPAPPPPALTGMTPRTP